MTKRYWMLFELEKEIGKKRRHARRYARNPTEKNLRLKKTCMEKYCHAAFGGEQLRSIGTKNPCVCGNPKGEKIIDTHMK